MKTLEELKNQKKWTGDEAGLVYLYSTENDILSSRENGYKTDADSLEQNFFNKITQYIRYRPLEVEKYKFYLRLDNCLNDLEKNFRYYDMQFQRYIVTAMYTFNLLDNNSIILNKINDLNISQTSKEDIFKEAISINNFINSSDLKYKYYRTLLYESHKFLKNDLTYFYASNFTLDFILEKENLQRFKTLLLDIAAYEKEIDELNKSFNKICKEQSCENIEKLKLYYSPINYTFYKPMKEDKAFLESLFQFGKNPKKALIEYASDYVLSLANKVLYRTGEVNGQ